MYETSFHCAGAASGVEPGVPMSPGKVIFNVCNPAMYIPRREPTLNPIEGSPAFSPTALGATYV